MLAGFIDQDHHRSRWRDRRQAECRGHEVVGRSVAAARWTRDCLLRGRRCSIPPIHWAHGSIAAILAAAPTLCVQQWEAVQRGDHAVALAIHNKLLRIWNAMPHDNLPANVKTAMRLQGRDGGIPRAPMQPSSPAQEAALRSALQAAGLL
ncbi:MAG: dihydrodipicolinate synthase family protein [Caldilineaceae bacterium]